MLNHSTLKIQHLIVILIIPVLCLFTIQAAQKSIAAIQLTNAGHFLQNASLANIEKALSALQKVQQLTPDDPAYHHLSANAKHWQTLLEEKTNIHSAQQHYRLGLKAQPDNPFLWSGLAKTDLAWPKAAASLNAMEYASHYAPSDHNILSNTVFWIIPQWQHLNRQQQQRAIEQLTTLVSKRETKHKTQKQLNQLIKESGQRTVICSKLPRTENFKNICY